MLRHLQQLQGWIKALQPPDCSRASTSADGRGTKSREKKNNKHNSLTVRKHIIYILDENWAGSVVLYHVWVFFFLVVLFCALIKELKHVYIVLSCTLCDAGLLPLFLPLSITQAAEPNMRRSDAFEKEDNSFFVVVVIFFYSFVSLCCKQRKQRHVTFGSAVKFSCSQNRWQPRQRTNCLDLVSDIHAHTHTHVL